jgi:ADP-ribosyl-[dinitrogen reductase] hydrolase
MIREMNERHIEIADRFRGVMLGLACGDALGGPVEFMSRTQIRDTYPRGVTEFVGGGWLHLAPGEVTDDTQQALILARALTADGLDMDRFAAGLLEWYHSRPKDIGNTTRVALAALAAGTPPLEAGEVAVAERGVRGTASNGGVMRCAPVSLRFRNDPDRLVSASRDSARVTHAEERAVLATVAVNQAIAHLLNGGSVADAPGAAVSGIDHDEVRQRVLGAAMRNREDLAAGGFVLETIESAFWALATGADLRDVIERGVALGEDADSTGAVAGAMAGAAYGASALPSSWTSRVQFANELASEADRILKLTS